MKTEHTKGKMEYAFGSGIIEDTGILEADRRTDRTTPTERDANVRRAVACWNVCDGYSTEFLEKLVANKVGIIISHSDLLEACKAMEIALSEVPCISNKQEASRIQARQAIRKAEGKE